MSSEIISQEEMDMLLKALEEEEPCLLTQERKEEISEILRRASEEKDVPSHSEVQTLHEEFNGDKDETVDFVRDIYSKKSVQEKQEYINDLLWDIAKRFVKDLTEEERLILFEKKDADIFTSRPRTWTAEMRRKVAEEIAAGPTKEEQEKIEKIFEDWSVEENMLTQEECDIIFGEA